MISRGPFQPDPFCDPVGTTTELISLSVVQQHVMPQICRSVAVRGSACSLLPWTPRCWSKHVEGGLVLKAFCHLCVCTAQRDLPPAHNWAGTNPPLSPELVGWAVLYMLKSLSREDLPRIGCSRAGLWKNRAFILHPRGFFAAFLIHFFCSLSKAFMISALEKLWVSEICCVRRSRAVC